MPVPALEFCHSCGALTTLRIVQLSGLTEFRCARCNRLIDAQHDDPDDEETADADA